MERRGNSLLETRHQNQILIKNAIYHTKNATRTGVAQQLHLTKPTITTNVNAMMAEGMLEEVPIAEEDLSNVMGRRPNAIRFCPGYACSIGIELGPYEICGVRMDLGGGIQCEVRRSPASKNYEEMFEQVISVVKQLTEHADSKILGIEIGLPGFIDNETGIIRRSPRAKWDNTPLASDVQERTGIPTHIDNNVRLRASGYTIARNMEEDTFAYFYISKGIACPLIVDSHCVSGNSYGAGELGQTLLGSLGEPPVWRKADDLASETAIMERCQEKLLMGKIPELATLMRREGRIDIEMVLGLEHDGQPEVVRIMRDTMEYAGAALSNVVNLMNPGTVVVDAYIMREPMNRRYLQQFSQKYFYGLNEREVRLHFLDFDHLRGATGAAYQVIQTELLDA